MNPLAYFREKYVPLADANVNIMTHAFNYGTGCFEGIRGYWNEAERQMFLFRMTEHYQRLLTSRESSASPARTQWKTCVPRRPRWFGGTSCGKTATFVRFSTRDR